MHQKDSSSSLPVLQMGSWTGCFSTVSGRRRVGPPEELKPVGFELMPFLAYPIPFLGHNLDPTPSFSVGHPQPEAAVTGHLSSSTSSG